MQCGKLSYLHRSTSSRTAAFWLVITLLCPLLHGQQAPDEITAVPNRPTFSTTAEAVQKGVLEIEAGYEAAKGLQDINELLKIGVLKNLELRVGSDAFLRIDGTAGTSDVGVGAKWRIFSQQHVLPTTSLLYTATLPSATHDLGTGAVGHALTLLLSKDFGKHHFDWNEGVQFIGRGGPSGFDRNYFSALAYSHPLTEKWALSGEVAGYSHLNAETGGSMTLLGAATYSPKSRLVFDFGAYGPVFGDLPRVVVFSGVTYSIADLYHRHRTGHARK